MIRQQFSIIAALAIACATPTYAGDYENQGSGWKAANQEASGTTLSGRLYRNSADQNGVAPYVLLDRFGVVRGYVSPGANGELDAYLGKQVSLQGSTRALPGGDMTCLTVDHVLGEPVRSNAQKATPPARATTAPARVRQPARAVDQDNFDGQQAAPARPVAASRPRAPQPQRAVVDTNYNATPVQASAPVQRTARANRPQAVSYQEPVPPASVMHATPTSIQPSMTVQPIPVPDNGPMMGSMNGPMIESPEMSGPMEQESQAPFIENGYVEQGSRHVHHGAPMMTEGDGGCDVCESGSCDDGCCDGLPPHRPIFTVGPTGLWVQSDFLLWSERGMNVPALVTSGPNASNPGYLNDPSGTTQILYGNGLINDEIRAGGRIVAGVWLNSCQTIGIEGEYEQLQDESSPFYVWSNGNPIISRPYFNVGPGTTTAAGVPLNQQDVELVAESGVLAGSVAVDAKTQFSSEGARFVFALCKCEGCWSDGCKAYQDSYHSYLMVGYRHMDLNDTLGIQEYLTDSSFTSYAVHDEFDTRNAFNGGELSMKFELQRNRWWFDVTPKIALGDTHQTVNIGGSTSITNPAGSTTSYTGGLLAQSTNIGSYSRDVFGAVPEIDLNLGYQITPHARLELGYTFIYWNNVVRSGDQIDTSVNADHVPQFALTGLPNAGDQSRPRFAFEQTSFWAQGANIGLKLTW